MPYNIDRQNKGIVSSSDFVLLIEFKYNFEIIDGMEGIPYDFANTFLLIIGMLQYISKFSLIKATH